MRPATSSAGLDPLARLQEHRSVLLTMVGGLGAPPATHLAVDAVAVLREVLGEGPSTETTIDRLRHQVAVLEARLEEDTLARLAGIGAQQKRRSR